MIEQDELCRKKTCIQIVICLLIRLDLIWMDGWVVE